MRQLRAVLAALAAVILALVPGQAGLPVLAGKAHYALLSAGDAALAAPDLASWTRPQGDSRDGDAVDTAPNPPPAAPEVAGQSGWPAQPETLSGHASPRLPPARGPPGPVA